MQTKNKERERDMNFTHKHNTISKFKTNGKLGEDFITNITTKKLQFAIYKQVVKHGGRKTKT